MVEIFIFLSFFKILHPRGPPGKDENASHKSPKTNHRNPWAMGQPLSNLPNAQIPTLSNKNSEGIVPRHEESPEKCATQTTEGICLKQSSVVAT